MKTDLVIMTAGRKALFQQWGEYSQYDFDLAVINWSGVPLFNTESAAYVEDIVGQKWHIMAEFKKRHDLSQYRYIWCLDEDVQVSPEQIEKTFQFCADNNLDLAQPALAPGYHPVSHPVTLQIPGAKMHITNTVEMMAEIHSQRTWAEAMAPCADMPVGIGFGIEGYWEKVLESQNGTTKYGGRVAVIDCLPVVHTRPVTPIEVFIKERGMNPVDDGTWFINHGLTPQQWGFRTLEIINE